MHLVIHVLVESWNIARMTVKSLLTPCGCFEADYLHDPKVPPPVMWACDVLLRSKLCLPGSTSVRDYLVCKGPKGCLEK